MAEKPILFSTPMVQAILDGRKTQTRRVIKPLSDLDWHYERCNGLHSFFIGEYPNDECIELEPKYQIDNILWVREPWIKLDSCQYCMCDNEPAEHDGCYMHNATHDDVESLEWNDAKHMPREAARIFLRVTDVRAERLQSISPDDVKAEGIAIVRGSMANDLNRHKYKKLWDSLYAKEGYGWDTNPWVWVYTFERVEDA